MRVGTALIAMGLVAACGRQLAPDPDVGVAGGGDAGAEGGGDGKCATNAPFGVPEHLTDWLPGKSFLSVRRGIDGIWYVSVEVDPTTSPQHGYLGVYREQGSSLVPADAALLAQLVVSPATDSSDEEASISTDGLRLVFESDRDRGAQKKRTFQLYLSTRDRVGDPFGPPRAIGIDLLADPDRSFEEPYFAPLGRVVFSYQGSSTDETLARGTLVADAGAPLLDGPGRIGAVDSIQENGHAVVSEDGEELFFESQRDADGGKTNENVWHALKDGDGFTPPTLMTDLSTAGLTDYPSWLSPDRCDLWLIRKNEDGIKRVYFATRRAR